MTEIDALPTAPNRSQDPDTYIINANNMMAALPIMVEQINTVAGEIEAAATGVETDAATAAAAADSAEASAATALNAPGTHATSTTSLTIGLGAQVLTIQTGKDIVVGMHVACAATAGPTNLMAGVVTSYNSGTGVLGFTSTFVQGSGTASAWTVSLCAPFQTLTSMGAAERGANSSITSLAGLTTALSILQGGTGGTTAAAARAALSAAELGSNSTITSLSGLTTPLSPTQGGSGYAGLALRNYLSGLTMSTAGSSATMSIAAGIAANSTNAAMLALSAISKTTLAWAVGSTNGGLDTGTIANSTWYYFYVIRRPDTGVVDVIFSTSSSAPTLPANYTQYRYIGAGKTDGSAQWVKFTQSGRQFWWSTPVLATGAAIVGSTTAALQALEIPLGRKFQAVINIVMGGGAHIYVSDPDNADLAPSVTAAPLNQVQGSSSGQVTVFSDTSAQVRHRETAGGSNMYIATLGWTDLADSQ